MTNTRFSTLSRTLIGVDPETIAFDNVGDEFQINPVFTDSIQWRGRCTWASDNTDVATVSNTGYVTKTGLGSCNVSCSYGGDIFYTSITDSVE